MNGKKYILVVFPLFFLHAVEEYSTNFYAMDPSTQWAATLLHISAFSVFVGIQMVVALFLLFLLFRPNTLLLAAFGLILLVEFDHPIHTLFSRGYYPGVITSIPLILLSLFFWRDFIRSKMLN